jgi:surface polysaccharide O-acyltransferase-like enzyme
MISGALLLSHNEPYGSFFKKRLSRVFIPLLFWSLVYEVHLISQLYFHEFYQQTDISFWQFLSKSGNWWSVVKNPFAGPVYDHLWFLYMIIGMYLVTPLLRRIVPVLTRIDQWYLLGLWIFSDVILPLAYNYWHFSIGFNIPIVTPYLGFYLMGYYLMHHQFTAKQIRNTWIVFIASYLVNVIITWYDSDVHGQMQVFWLSHHRPGLFVMAGSAFILLEHYAMHAFSRFSEKKYKMLAYMGGTTFGIYLLHPLIIESFEGIFMGVIGIYPPAMHVVPFIAIPVAAVIVTAVTMGIVTLMQKTPLLKRFV